MSRIGKKPITIPENVEVTLEEKRVLVKGPKGELEAQVVNSTKVSLEDKSVVVTRANDSKDARARHGLMRALINNMIIGVTEGYKKELEIKGIGYRASMQGNDLMLNIGYSHSVVIKAPDGIKFTVTDGLNVAVEGIDKQKVGQLAATIREKRKPEPYKGKGIKYKDENIRRKSGKAKAKGA